MYEKCGVNLIMKVETIECPKFGAEGNIEAVIVTPTGERINTNLRADDPDSFGKALFESAYRGDFGPVAEYSQSDRFKDNIRKNAIVQQSLIDSASAICKIFSEEKDLGIISDIDLAKYKEWVKYRKALREVDITLSDTKWPDKPS